MWRLGRRGAPVPPRLKLDLLDTAVGSPWQAEASPKIGRQLSVRKVRAAIPAGLHLVDRQCPGIVAPGHVRRRRRGNASHQSDEANFNSGFSAVGALPGPAD